MAHARVVTHPYNWPQRYREIQKPPKRYGIFDLPELSSLCGFAGVAGLSRRSILPRPELPQVWQLLWVIMAHPDGSGSPLTHGRCAEDTVIESKL
jgi:hypothetical protein